MFVRRELPDDREAIHRIHVTAFARPDQPEGEPVFEARLVEGLRSTGDIISALSLVAVVQGTVVGHVVCSRATVGQDRRCVGLGPLGVLPEHQRQGIGQALMHAVLGAADALDVPAVALLGGSYYERFGFEPATACGIEAPEESWGEHFQVRRLTSWDSSTRGQFSYAAPFRS